MTDRFVHLLTLLTVTSLAGIATAAEPNTQWVTNYQAGRFRIHCDFKLPPDEPLKDDLAALSKEVGAMLGLPPNDNPIHVVLFSSAKEYGRYIRNYFPSVPERRALFIQHRGPGMLFAHWHPDVRTDIRHEVVHGLLNAQTKPLPLWLDEGLAEYFEVETPERLAMNPHLATTCAELKRNVIPSLEQLESLKSIEEFGSNQYRDSWAWVHFLLHRNPQTRKLLVDYLAQHRQDAAVEPLTRRIAIEVPEWPSDFEAHFTALAASKVARRAN
jgi:hypothetical protein